MKYGIQIDFSRSPLASSSMVVKWCRLTSIGFCVLVMLV